MKKKRFIITIIALFIILGIVLIFTNNKNLAIGWKKYSKEGNPILGDENTGSLFDPNVIKDYDGNYRMYVSWRNKGAIAVSISNDGINWSELKIVLEKI